MFPKNASFMLVTCEKSSTYTSLNLLELSTEKVVRFGVCERTICSKFPLGFSSNSLLIPILNVSRKSEYTSNLVSPSVKSIGALDLLVTPPKSIFDTLCLQLRTLKGVLRVLEEGLYPSAKVRYLIFISDGIFVHIQSVFLKRSTLITSSFNKVISPDSER